MTIRTRLTLWYGGMLLGSLLLMGGVLHYELIGEYQRGLPPESPARKIEDILLFYGLPTAIVLVLGGSWLVHRSLRPVQTLTVAIERIHAGNLAERVQPSGRGDELDRLAVIFNEMLARVETGIASVRDFTLHASHELKTPLTILSAETELALGDPATPASQHARLASQFEEVRRLAALVDALSLLAKADAGLPLVAREPLRFDEMLRCAVKNARVLGAARHITIDLIHCDPAPLEGDRAGLRQVLLNLFDNAVKHNQPRGWVRVELRLQPDSYTLTVENTGYPIPPELLPRVFERFVRSATAAEGSGLGLSIIKTVIEAHGGTVACVNRSESSTCFEIHLPRSGADS